MHVISNIYHVWHLYLSKFDGVIVQHCYVKVDNIIFSQ